MTSSKRLFILLICLYFSQGLPSGMLAHALPAIMREYGADNRWIGMIKLLALPWFLKFLWAPYIDQYWHRQHWIKLFQTGSIALLLAMSLLPPERIFSVWLIPFLFMIFLLNACSASQDIASDGLAVSHIDKRDLGLANSIQVGAYKVGLIGGGTLLLVLLDKLGWQNSLQVFAACLALALIPILLQPLPTDRTVATLPASGTQPHQPWRQVLAGFMRERNMGPWLGIIATYKMADGLSSAMIKPMLVDYGFSLADIGYLSTASSVAGIAGAIAGGILFPRLPLKAAMASFGALQAVGIGLMALAPGLSGSIQAIYGLAMFEQFTDNLSTVALFAAMMMHCRKGFEGTDYTLQNSIFLMGSGTTAVASGFIANAIGYPALFLLASVLGLLSLALLFLHRSQPALDEA